MAIPFVEKIKVFLDSNHLVRDNDRVVVGLSGGADSVALLTVLHELGYECVAVHCNFHLRGAESMRDERFCRDLCEKLGVELLIRDFDVMESKMLTGESVEMVCRRLRYDWWNELLQLGKGSVIAVGHHLEDNVETFFLNLLRGSGLTGLKGMLPKNLNVIRPLLNCRKQEIVDYVKSRGFGYVTDSSNLENDYKRNKLRNIIIPELEKVFPGATDAVATSISFLRDNYMLYSDYSDALRRKYVGHDGAINLTLLVTTEKNARMVLYEILSKVGINMTQVDNILASVAAGTSSSVSGKIFKTHTVSYLLDRGMLIPMLAEDAHGQAEGQKVDLFSPPFKSVRMSSREFMTMKEEGRLDKAAIYLDCNVLDCNLEFELRPWRKGDRLEPFGMKGSKLVSDLLSDAKYSLLDKQKVRILTCNGKILWVIGVRASRFFAVTDKTENVLEVRYIE